MKKALKDWEKEVKKTEELKKIYWDLWTEFSGLPKDSRSWERAKQIFTEFRKKYNVNAPDDYVRGMKELIRELYKIRLQDKVMELKEALKQPLPDEPGEARPARPFFPKRPLPDRILLLIAADEEMRTYVTDIAIARMLKGGLKVKDVRRELMTLKDSGLIHLRKEKVKNRPAYGAMLTPDGLAKAAWLEISRKATIH